MSYLNETYPASGAGENAMGQAAGDEKEYSPLPSDAKTSFTTVNQNTVVKELTAVLEDHNSSIGDIKDVAQLNADINRALRGEIMIVTAIIEESVPTTINDRLTIMFDVTYRNPTKTRFDKQYSQSRGSSQDSSTENKISISIEGLTLGTGDTDNSGTTNVDVHTQNYNVYNADYSVTIKYNFKAKGLWDLISKGSGTHYKFHTTRGTLETRMDKLPK